MISTWMMSRLTLNQGHTLLCSCIVRQKGAHCLWRVTQRQEAVYSFYELTARSTQNISTLMASWLTLQSSVFKLTVCNRTNILKYGILWTIVKWHLHSTHSSNWVSTYWSSKMWKAWGTTGELCNLNYHKNTSCTITDNYTACWMFTTSPSTVHEVHQWPPTRISRLLCRHQSIPRHSCHTAEARFTFSYPCMSQVPHWHATPCQD